METTDGSLRRPARRHRGPRPAPGQALDIGGVHLGTHQQTAGIGDNMAFSAFNLLGRIVTTRPAALGGLDRLTVDHPADGLASRPTASRACSSNSKLILLETFLDALRVWSLRELKEEIGTERAELRTFWFGRTGS